MRFDDLENKSRHLHKFNVIGAGWLFHISLISNLSAKHFVKL